MGMYEFTLTYELKDKNEDPTVYIDKLYEAGCDDAVIGVGRKGMIALDFAREGQDKSKVVESSLIEVRKAIPESKLIDIKW